jgi:hypothetical protein
MLAGAALVAGAFAQVALHLAEPPLPVTWGYAHLSRAAALPWIAALLVLALPPLGALVWRRLGGAPLRPYGRARVAIIVAGVAVVLAAAGLWFPMGALSIDPVVFRIWVVRGDVNERSDLWLRLLALITQPLTPVFLPWRTALVLTGVLGSVTLVSLIATARRLARDRAEALAIALIACTAFGVARMSFGVVDVYPIALLLTALFFWSALRTLDGDGHPVWPLLIVATGPFWYLGLVLLVPAGFVLLAELLRRRATRGPAVLAAAVALVAAGLATLPSTGRAFALDAFFSALGSQTALDLGTSPGALHSREMLLSGQHLYNVFNTAVMVDGVGILCTLTVGVWLAARRLYGLTWDPFAVMLGGTAAGQLFYIATFDQTFSPAAQWDLFSYTSVATALFGGWALMRWGRRAGPRTGWVVGLVVALALVHLLARLGATHLDLKRHERESPPTWQPPSPPSP